MKIPEKNIYLNDHGNPAMYIILFFYFGSEDSERSCLDVCVCVCVCVCERERERERER